jgi:hypothetical protein
MTEFLSAGPNLPFSVALAMMLIMAAIEGVGFLLGLGVFDFLDGLAPDVDFDSVDATEMAGMSLADRFMGWLHFGRVPVLILLVVFLTSFGVIGLGIQGAAAHFTGHLLPGVLASAIALPAALPPVRWFGGMLAKVLPKDETYVVSQDALVGRVATIVLGTARSGSPAQGRVRDQHGQTHYVMVEPDDSSESFAQGEHALLVSRQGSTYRAIRNTNASMVN